jgi:hypothetical protein
MYRLGLGSTWKQTTDGTFVDCDLASNLFTGACWNPFNPQLAGPATANPTAPSNPLTDVALGVNQTGSGQDFTLSDYTSSILGSGSSLVWVGLIGVGLIVVLMALKR